MAMTTKQATEKWSISDRRVRTLCVNGQIDGAWREGKIWYIPDNSPKPVDGRFRAKESLLTMVEQKKAELDLRRPLTEGEAERLNEDFMIENTYNSNAIEGNTLTLRETDMALKGLTIEQKPLKDHMEAVGYKDAFYYICDLVKDKVPLSESVIKQIHTLVLADKPMDRGVYRRRAKGAGERIREVGRCAPPRDPSVPLYGITHRRAARPDVGRRGSGARDLTGVQNGIP